MKLKDLAEWHLNQERILLAEDRTEEEDACLGRTSATYAMWRAGLKIQADFHHSAASLLQMVADNDDTTLSV